MQPPVSNEAFTSRRGGKEVASDATRNVAIAIEQLESRADGVGSAFLTEALASVHKPIQAPAGRRRVH